ncbi:MAG: GNAT family N-acetyltransferase [Loktanella sp.]|nr:GNAT family N-acetyltransferase [Loktanella sp.]
MSDMTDHPVDVLGAPRFVVKTAESKADLQAAQRLRYLVFVQELGGDGPLVDHENMLECDEFDAYATHLILHDMTRPAADNVIGVYRLLTSEAAQQAGQFYCETEFDLGLLRSSGLKLLELGRSCLHPDYRGGMAMMHLWQALAVYVQDHGIELLFGVASFHGTDLAYLSGPLGLLFHRHLAPPELRVHAIGQGARAIAPVAEDQIDRVAALRDTPALIKAYLRLGGVVGEGIYVDTAFNTTDVCLILPLSDVSLSQRQLYTRARRDV